MSSGLTQTYTCLNTLMTDTLVYRAMGSLQREQFTQFYKFHMTHNIECFLHYSSIWHLLDTFYLQENTDLSLQFWSSWSYPTTSPPLSIDDLNIWSSHLSSTTTFTHQVCTLRELNWSVLQFQQKFAVSVLLLQQSS